MKGLEDNERTRRQRKESNGDEVRVRQSREGHLVRKPSHSIYCVSHSIYYVRTSCGANEGSLREHATLSLPEKCARGRKGVFVMENVMG